MNNDPTMTIDPATITTEPHPTLWQRVVGLLVPGVPDFAPEPPADRYCAGPLVTALAMRRDARRAR